MVSTKRVAILLIACALGSAAACERVKSANPLSPHIAGPLPGVSITAPRVLEPSPGTRMVSTGGPQSLLIENAGTSGPRELFLQIEIAADDGFQQLLHHAERVAPGPEGRTTYRLPEPLGTGHTYYVRARAADGANTGPYSAISYFQVVDPVVLEPPTPLEPNGAIATNRPEFRVRNGGVSGPAGQVIYRMELATAPDPSAVVAVVTATPHPSGTTGGTIGDLPWDRTFYWRVQATDGEHVSPFSGIVSFKTPAAPTTTPPPGPGPGPSPGPSPGAGGRTPDPPPGQRLPLPNMIHVVQQVAAARPDLLHNSCQEHGGTWGFMDLLVDTLRSHDTRWGYNWKRGNVGDPSLDVVDYHWGRGASEGSSEVYIIDVIAGHCGSSPSAAWTDVTDITYSSGTIGRWTGRGRF